MLESYSEDDAFLKASEIKEYSGAPIRRDFHGNFLGQDRERQDDIMCQVSAVEGFLTAEPCKMEKECGTVHQLSTQCHKHCQVNTTSSNEFRLQDLEDRMAEIESQQLGQRMERIEGLASTIGLILQDEKLPEELSDHGDNK